jgi:hypothetical protein
MVYGVNRMVGVVEGVRWALVGTPLGWPAGLAVSGLISGGLLGGGGGRAAQLLLEPGPLALPRPRLGGVLSYRQVSHANIGVRHDPPEARV